MKPLIVLLIVFTGVLYLLKVIRGNYEWDLSGRIAMSAMLLFTAIGHFTFAKGMTLMIPEFIPFKAEIVFLSGIAEIIFAIGLLIPNLQNLSAWILILFLILVLPANIYAAIKQVDYQNGTFQGNGLNYLWFRIPLQLFFIFWTYVSAIYK